jgi:hypothetical protein
VAILGFHPRQTTGFLKENTLSIAQTVNQQLTAASIGFSNSMLFQKLLNTLSLNGEGIASKSTMDGWCNCLNQYAAVLE